jgi:tRNA uridine 5-carboxymethylaminomethyl modification enzyme
MELTERVGEWLEGTNAAPDRVNPLLESLGSAPLREPTRIASLLRRPGVSVGGLLDALDLPDFAAEPGELEEVFAGTEMELRYAGYLDRERDRARTLQRQGGFPLPADLPYPELTSLSIEARQKLDRVRPATIGQAARIPGVSPSDLQNLVMEVRKGERVNG